MGTLLHHFPIFHHYNMVGVFDCTQTMGDKDYCFLGTKSRQVLHNHQLVVGVQSISGFIKKS